MSDTDGSKADSDFDDQTYGSKKRKTKQKVNYTVNLTPMQQVLFMIFELCMIDLQDQL
jgi:hypothetical protein